MAVGDVDRDGILDLAAAQFGARRGLDSARKRLWWICRAGQPHGGGKSYAVVIADLNGDGKPDFAVANGGSNNGSILLGGGGGTFAAAVNYDVGVFPASLAAGDLNGDGKLDLAVANVNSHNVSTFIGTGGRAFVPAANYGAGNFEFVAVGDLNSDGKPDLMAANGLAGGVASIFINSGACSINCGGSFPPDTGYASGGGFDTYSIAMGDLNRDGRQDLAFAKLSDTVSTVLGNGDGTFAAPADLIVTGRPTSVDIGDLNRDGKPDLAVVNNASDQVSVLLGNGDGTFLTPVPYATGKFPLSVGIGDLNRDGKPDLVVANGGTGAPSDVCDVSVLLGNGDYVCRRGQLRRRRPTQVGCNRRSQQQRWTSGPGGGEHHIRQRLNSHRKRRWDLRRRGPVERAGFSRIGRNRRLQPRRQP